MAPLPGARTSARRSCRCSTWRSRSTGMVTREALREIGGLLGITTAEVEAVATFYSMYRLRPTGEHVVNVCTNLACKLRGAARGLRGRPRGGGHAHGEERSDDGLFTVHEEECLGVCDFAPAVQINFCNHDDRHARADARADRDAPRAARCPSPRAARRSRASRPRRARWLACQESERRCPPRETAFEPRLTRNWDEPRRGRARRLRGRRRLRGPAHGRSRWPTPTSSRS